MMDGRKVQTSTSSSTKTLKLTYSMTKAEEEQLKKMYYQHEIKNVSTNPKIIRGLHRDIQTQNEQLKYEYIEMIRSGRGEEFMKYLLSSIFTLSYYYQTPIQTKMQKFGMLRLKR